ncbi:MAG: dTDP-4-dehydrorhamnose 3,5-epimerase [Motiliproteus sp.]|jgi:dTDP-4-dehydrorhamnose 3,5-epimerase
MLTIKPLFIADSAEITTQPRVDHRGYFSRIFCQQALHEINGGRAIQQMNLSFSKTCGTLRGLHYQSSPSAEDKIVRCMQGRIFDVMLDIRQDSATFGQYQTIELDAEEGNMVYIPRGVAHGFQTLRDDCLVMYMHTEFHDPAAEGGFHYASSSLNIPWPLAVKELSPRDQDLPEFNPNTPGIAV